MSKYQDLIDKVRAATGPDRELDAEIDAALFGGYPAKKCHDSTRRSYGPGYIHNADDGSNLTQGGRNSPCLTVSIDACTAIIDRKLPDWWWLREDGISIRLVGPDNGEYNPSSEGKHELVPHAMLLALLLALQSNEATNVE